MNCPQCQAAIQPGNQFCFRCGGQIGNTGGVGQEPASGGRADAGQHRRQTQGDDGLFESTPPPSPTASAPPPQARGGRRATILDDDDELAPPPRAQMSAGGARPARPRTMLDDGEAASTAAVPAAHANKIIGWMVSYDRNPLGQEYTLRAGRTTIGKGRDNSVSLFFDSKVSSQHAEIIYRHGICSVVDVRSTNGTFINEEDLGVNGTRALRSGDVLTVGASQFLVYLLDLEITKGLWPDVKWGRK